MHKSANYYIYVFKYIQYVCMYVHKYFFIYQANKVHAR